MRIKWIVLAAVAMFALPSAAVAHNSDAKTRNAAKLCKGLKAELGVDGFKEAYASNNGRNAHGKCVSRHRHLIKLLIGRAVSQCKTELGITGKSLRHGRPAGDQEHGNDDKPADKPADKPVGKREAFRACVKEKLKALLADLKAKFAAAIEQCKTERATDQAAFETKYGKGKKHRGAFGRCVYQHVRESLS